MPTYRDRTFCSQDTCFNLDCTRLITAEVRGNARNSGLLMSIADLKGKEDCPGYLSSQDLVDEIMEKISGKYWREEE